MRRFTLPIFGTRISYTNDPDEARQWAKRNSMADEVIYCDGWCAANGTEVLIYTKGTRPGLVAHEAYHAAARVLEAIGAEGQDEETIAHITEYIVDKCQC